MAQRIWIALALLVASLLLLRIGLASTSAFPLRETLVGIGADLVSLALTVALVDLLLERRQREERRRRIAWELLRSFDKAVWVWQGGWREFRIGELIRLLMEVKESDPLPGSTVEFFEAVGRLAEDALYAEDGTISGDRALVDVLQELGKLTDLRHSPILQAPRREFANNLIEIALELARFLHFTPEPFPPDWVHKTQDSGLAAQMARYQTIFGSSCERDQDWRPNA